MPANFPCQGEPRPRLAESSTAMMDHLKNIGYLTAKEFRSLFGDRPLMGLIVALYTVITVFLYDGLSIDVNNAAVVVIDHDNTTLSRRIGHSLHKPTFNARIVNAGDDQVDLDMQATKTAFALEIPEGFEEETLKGRPPKMALRVDATAMIQAAIGARDIQSRVASELVRFAAENAAASGGAARSALAGITSPPLKVETRAAFNQTMNSSSRIMLNMIMLYTSTMTIVFVGAAVIREKEHGTLEHLLAMPVTAFEIAISKILANSTVILVASLLSLRFVIQGYLGIPVRGSYLEFAILSAVFLFSAAAMGLFIATLAPTLPQSGLLSILFIALTLLMSGALAPVENMPKIMQDVVQLLPQTHFIIAGSDILFKGAQLSQKLGRLFATLALGIVYLSVSLSMFRRMLERQS